ncbi:MAG: hypothetical protein ACRDUA_17685 [Micromonosporaceae bacterium]
MSPGVGQVHDGHARVVDPPVQPGTRVANSGVCEQTAGSGPLLGHDAPVGRRPGG